MRNAIVPIRIDAPIDADMHAKIAHDIPILDRPGPAELPEDLTTFSSREHAIFQRVTHFLPRKEFPIFYEWMVDAFVKNNIEEEGGIMAVNPLHLSLMDFYRRAVGAMDSYFDEHRSEFVAQLKAGDAEALRKKLFAVPVKKPEYQGFTVGEMFALIRKSINSPKVYQSEKARAFLNQLYDCFEQSFFETLLLEAEGIEAMGLDETIRLKSGTNVDHGRLMFYLAVADFCDHPGFKEQEYQLEAAKIAYQFRNDLQGVAKDLLNGNANFVVAIATNVGEEQKLSRKLETEFLKELSVSAPETYRVVKSIQEQLLALSVLPEGIKDILQV